MRIRTDHPHCHCEGRSPVAISLYSVAITWVSTAPKASLVKGRWPSVSEVGGGRQQALPSIAILRRIRTAAGLPPPFGHPPHKCGGQGDCAYLRASPFAQDDKSGGTAKNAPVSGETGAFVMFRSANWWPAYLSALPTYSWGPAATRALPSSLPVYLTKFFWKRAARSSAFAFHSDASA